MKPVYIVSWLLALAVSFVSCDDWLDKTPKDRLYPDVYFKTEDELRLFTNQFYNNLIPAAADIYSYYHKMQPTYLKYLLSGRDTKSPATPPRIASGMPLVSTVVPISPSRSS